MVFFIVSEGAGCSFFEIIREVTFISKPEFIGNLSLRQTCSHAGFYKFNPVIIDVGTEGDTVIVFKVFAEVMRRDIEGM